MMIYINSKGEERGLEELNDGHLHAAHTKAQRVADHYARCVAGEYNQDAARYCSMVARSLWMEIARRKSLPLDERFDKRFPTDMDLNRKDVREWLREQQENG